MSPGAVTDSEVIGDSEGLKGVRVSSIDGDGSCIARVLREGINSRRAGRVPGEVFGRGGV